jgi:hypothetical protein
MDGACSTHGTDEKWIQLFGLKTRIEETTRKTNGCIWVRIGTSGGLL